MKEVADIVFCEREKTNKKINVKIVCNTEMQELNKTFRNKDKNTNVLAFVNDDESKEQTQEFGDIAICYPYLEKRQHRKEKVLTITLVICSFMGFFISLVMTIPKQHKEKIWKKKR